MVQRDHVPDEIVDIERWIQDEYTYENALPTSLFGDATTIERRTDIAISSSFGTSSVRDEILTSGSGEVTKDPASTGEIELSTGTTANSEIDLRTASYGRYVPGFSAQAGIGVRFESLPTEGEVTWGYFDEDNGFYWGYDGDAEELFVALLSNGSETRIYQGKFNGDDFEKTFGHPVDLTRGHIFQIDFTWYGYGIVNFQIVSQTESKGDNWNPEQETMTMHSIAVQSTTSIADPNQPIRIAAKNGSSGEDVRVRLGGRQFSVFGGESDKKRVTSETSEDVSITNGVWTHVMSWQRRDDVGDKNATLTISGVDFGTDVGIRLAFLKGASISATNFRTPSLTDSSETLVDVSTDGSYDGIGGGTKLWEGSIKVEQGETNKGINSIQQIPFGQMETISLIVKGLSGNGSGLATVRINEDW